jgi:hypothetical protein
MCIYIYILSNLAIFIPGQKDNASGTNWIRRWLGPKMLRHAVKGNNPQQLTEDLIWFIATLN